MIPEVALISVHHTGTSFTVDLLKSHGFKDTTLNATKAEGASTLYHGHITMSQCQMTAELGRRMPVIIPMRHPYRVEESWRRRRKDISEMLNQFKLIWERIITKLDPFVLPVDSERRAEFIPKLGAVLGVNIHTDWPLVRSIEGTHDIAIDDLTPGVEVQQLVQNLKPWLKRFYD